MSWLNFTKLVMNAGLALSLSWPIHQLPIASFYSEWIAVIGCLLTALLYLTHTNYRQQTWAIPQGSILLASLAGIVLLQLMQGYYAYTAHAIVILAYLLIAGITLMVARNMADKMGVEQGLKAILPGLILAGFLNFVAAILQKFGATELLSEVVVPLNFADKNGAYGNLAQQNHFANLQALSLIACLFWQSQQSFYRAAKLLLMLCFAIGLIISGARSAWLYLVVILGYLIASSSLPKLSHVWRIVAFSFIAISLLFVASAILPESQWQRYLTLHESLGARAFLWSSAIQISCKYPILGVGFEGFAYHVIRLLPESGQAVRWGVDQYPHNLILQLAANAGLPFLVLFCIVAVWFLRYVYRQRRRRGRHVALALLLILAIHSLIEQPLFYTYFLIPASFLWGLCDRNLYRLGHNQQRAILLVGMTAICTALVGAYKFQHDYQRVEMLVQKPHELQNLALASYRNETQVLRQWRHYSTYPGLLEAVFPAAFVAESAHLEAQVELNYRLLRYAPVAEVIYRHAVLLARLGQTEQAQQYLSMAMLAYPNTISEYSQRFRALCEQRINWSCMMAQQAQQIEQKLITH